MASSKASRPQPDIATTANTGAQASAPNAPQHDDNPWDAESAEALTRAYEESEAAWRESHATRRRLSHDRGPQQQASASGGGSALEGRLMEIADRLQRSIADIDPNRSADTLGHRIDELDERLTAALVDVAHRLDGHNLDKVEAQISGLAERLEQTRTQLDRLDAIDGRLRDIADRLDSHQTRAAAGTLDENSVASLIEAAADRAASRLAETLPAAAAGLDVKRIDALEEMMQTQIAERRRAEEMTANVLRAIEDGLTRIMDKVEATEPDDGLVDLATILPTERTRVAAGTAADDALLDIYAEGARTLGELRAASLLDAADYTTDASAPSQDAAGDADASDDADRDVATADASEPTAASAATQEQPAAAADALDPVEPDAVAIAGQGNDDKAPRKSGSRIRLMSVLLALLLALPCGVGYLVVDRYLARAPAPIPHIAAQTTQPAAQPAEPVRPVPVALSAEEAVRPAAPALEVVSTVPGLPDAIGASALREAAGNGDPVAQFEIASRFADGRGVPANAAEAHAWYLRAAMKGYAPAQFRLGSALELGVGVGADLEKAKVWYGRAAEQGHAAAMHNLAAISVRSGAEKQDYVTAAKWFREAADRGITDSQYNYGVLCQQGVGVSKNLSEAYTWLAIAARSGDKEAVRRIERLKSQLSASELKAAEQRIAEWKPRPSAESISGLTRFPAAPAAAVASGG